MDAAVDGDTVLVTNGVYATGAMAVYGTMTNPNGGVAWAKQLNEAGAARVTAFDLSGLILADGTQGKDLADVARISADCFDRERKFWEVLPK